MLQSDHKYKELVFQPVIGGGVCCIHRPSRGGIHCIAHNPCTAVVTLLSPSEDPHEIGNVCKQLGLKWIWVPLQGANKKLLESSKTSWLIRKALLQAKELLKQNHFILVHCAAGIHRTGLFTYALLRIVGLNKEETLNKIQEIRKATFEKCGKSRFELAESIALQLLEETITQEMAELSMLNVTDVIEEPLVWINLSMTHCQDIRFECIITDKTLNQYILGPNLNLTIDYAYLISMVGQEWTQLKGNKYLPGGIKKNFKHFEKEFLEFCNECFPKGKGMLIGHHSFLTQRFIKQFWPSIDDYLSEEIFDTSVFDESYRSNIETLTQEIMNFKRYEESVSENNPTVNTKII